MGKRNLVWFSVQFPICVRIMPIIVEQILFNTLRNEDPDLLLAVVGISRIFAAIFAATALLLVMRVVGIVATISATVLDGRT